VKDSGTMATEEALHAPLKVGNPRSAGLHESLHAAFTVTVVAVTHQGEEMAMMFEGFDDP
jgi:hypothetical protein